MAYQPSVLTRHQPVAVRKSSWVWLLLLVGSLLLVGLAIFKTVRLGTHLQSAYRSGQEFAHLLQNGINGENYALAHRQLQQAATDLAAADAEMRFFRLLCHGLRWLPEYGPTIAALPELVNLGKELSGLGVAGFGVAQPLLTAPPGLPTLAWLPVVLDRAQPQLPMFEQQITQAQEVLTGIPAEQLRWGLAEPVTRLQTFTALLAAGVHLSPAVPHLLGIDEPRHYLILAQNNHELRGTGGFITSIGYLTVSNGEVSGLEFADSYTLERTDLTYPTAPLPMQRYLHMKQTLLRDVNWSPDFPTTARLAQAIYAQSTGQPVDGVLTLDLQAVELLIGAVTPLTVPGVAEAITPENFVAQAKILWAEPAQSTATRTSDLPAWWEQRKDFIPLVAKAVLERLQSGSADQWRVAEQLYLALEQRTIQLWVEQPEAAARLAHLRWDGALRPTPASDFLALVDSNFGYNKVNAVVERTLSYQVAWPAGAGQPAIATVYVTYRHPLTITDAECDPQPHYGLTYDDMVARCFFNFVRLYAPAGSKLLGVEGLAPDSLLNETGEAGTQLFGGYFVLPPGQQQRIAFQYRLPPALQPPNYQLLVQRQSGAQALPLQVEVAGQKITTALQGGWLVWRLGL